MFQKTKNSMSNDPYSLDNVGDFYFSANAELTNNLLGKLSSSLGGQDLAEICLDWSKKITKKKKLFISVMITKPHSCKYSSTTVIQ